MRGNRRQKRPEDLQGRGSRYTGTKTILLEWTPEQLAAREAAIGVAIAQVERTCGGLARTFGAGSREPASAAKSEVASLKPRDARGRFLKVEGDRIVASERKPRKRRADPPPEPAAKPKRRRRKSQASLIREQMRAAGQWPIGR